MACAWLPAHIPFKRLLACLLALLLFALPALAQEELEETIEEIVPPQWEVPDYVTWLLEIAGEEVGYREGDHGYSKYGEWAGDPYAQWCAEFLCWCVDQTDQRHGTELLEKIYPLYSGSNTGRNWFIQQGRYVVRNGHLENWGYQWLKGTDRFLTTGDYIPQPGDWVFFTWTDTQDTDHVAMVEYCTRDEEGNVTVHVIEGNNPVAVERNTYSLTYTRILGYGTVHDVADWTMRSGNSGEKVRQLQEMLVTLGYLNREDVDGSFGSRTVNAVQAFQAEMGLRASGIANMETQQLLAQAVTDAIRDDPTNWIVVDEE